MSDFDPYLKWLCIRESLRPPNHYRLLGLDLMEGDLEVISGAADRQMAHVRTFQHGPPEVSRRRAIGLDKRIKESSEAFGDNSDAGIVDGNTKAGIWCLGRIDERARDPNASGLGELDRVADQVD